MNPETRHSRSPSSEPPAEASSPQVADVGSAMDDDWISRHYEAIHRAAWYMTGDAWEAEDLAQETFVTAFDCRDRFSGRSSDATWLYGILIRLHQRRRRSFVRMKRRLVVYLDRVCESNREPQDPQIQLAHRQWRDSVWADVARLPDNQRIAVILRYAEGLTYEDIAQSLGCAEGTVKTRVHHGLKRLRTFVDDSPMPETPQHEPRPTSDLQTAIHINARW